MANATISAPSGTQNGNFNVMATFDVAVTDFQKTDVTLTARTENGITGIDFTLTGSGTDYNLFFTLPANVEGSFQIAITGQVTPTGSTTPEAVMAAPLVVHYDNTLNVSATFGTVEYRDNGVVVVPVNFAENVIVPSKTVFQVTKVSGDDLKGIDYRLVGEDTDYELIFEIPPERSGSFRISAIGDAFKVSSMVWDNVVATPKTVNYDTRVPRIVNYDIPENYTHNAKFDVRLAFNVPITGLNTNDVPAAFLLEGADLGTPSLYRWTGANPPDFNTPQADALTDWTLAYPADEGQYFLIRFGAVPATATGIFNITLKENSVRGPIGS